MRLISSELQCGEEPASNNKNDDEEEEEHVGPITFHITLPSTSLPSLTSSSDDDDNTIPLPYHHQSRRFEFKCRDRSCGVLLPTEPSVPVNTYFIIYIYIYKLELMVRTSQNYNA
jgi:hypothetical protein